MTKTHKQLTQNGTLIPLKQWVTEEADRLGIKPVSVYHRKGRGLYPKSMFKTINPRVVYVKVFPATV